MTFSTCISTDSIALSWTLAQTISTCRIFKEIVRSSTIDAWCWVGTGTITTISMTRITAMIPLILELVLITAWLTSVIRVHVITISTCSTPHIPPIVLTSQTIQPDSTDLANTWHWIGIKAIRTRGNTHFQVQIVQRACCLTLSAVLCVLSITFLTSTITISTNIICSIFIFIGPTTSHTRTS